MRSCCWRTWVEYGSAAEATSKGSVTKEEFGKWLESQASSRIRDSRDLEAFWSAFCATSGAVSDDGVECNLRFFRDGIQPSWEGSGAHGKFTYSTKKRFTKVKLFALIRTAVLEVNPPPSPSAPAADSCSQLTRLQILTHSVHVCGIVLSCRDQKVRCRRSSPSNEARINQWCIEPLHQDFISVWNTGSEAAAQQQMLDELMSVRTFSTPFVFMCPSCIRCSISHHPATACITLLSATCCPETCGKGLQGAPCTHRISASRFITKKPGFKARTSCL
jgi:hypothetical protein